MRWKMIIKKHLTDNMLQYSEIGSGYPVLEPDLTFCIRFHGPRYKFSNHSNHFMNFYKPF